MAMFYLPLNGRMGRGDFPQNMFTINDGPS